MKQTGQLLKNARNEQGLSLTEVSMATKISPKILGAIEEGDLNNLPAKTFLRGFVRSYAAFLKIDLDLALQTFQDEMGSTLAEPQIESSQTDPSWAGTPLPQLADRVHSSKIFAVVGIVALIVIIIFVRNIVVKYEQEAKIAELPPELTQLTGADLPVDDEAGTEDTQKAETADSTTGKTLPAESATTPVQPSQESRPSAPPLPPPSVDATPTTPTSPSVPVESEAPIEPSPPASMEVIFEALDRVQISFRIGNRRPEQITLEPDQVHTLRAQGVLAVELSDGGAVNVIYNGRDLGVPGDLGRPKRLRFP